MSSWHITSLEKVPCGSPLCDEGSHFPSHTRRNVIVLVTWVHLHITHCQRRAPNKEGTTCHDYYIMRCETAWIIQCFARKGQLQDGLHVPKYHSMGWCNNYTIPKCTFGERVRNNRPNCHILKFYVSLVFIWGHYWWECHWFFFRNGPSMIVEEPCRKITHFIAHVTSCTSAKLSVAGA